MDLRQDAVLQPVVAKLWYDVYLLCSSLFPSKSDFLTDFLPFSSLATIFSHSYTCFAVVQVFFGTCYAAAEQVLLNWNIKKKRKRGKEEKGEAGNLVILMHTYVLFCFPKYNWSKSKEWTWLKSLDVIKSFTLMKIRNNQSFIILTCTHFLHTNTVSPRIYKRAARRRKIMIHP